MPMGEPQLGKRGLYSLTGGKHIADRDFAMLWMLNQSDGKNSVLDISERSSLPFSSLVAVAEDLVEAGLLVS